MKSCKQNLSTFTELLSSIFSWPKFKIFHWHGLKKSNTWKMYNWEIVDLFFLMSVIQIKKIHKMITWLFQNFLCDSCSLLAKEGYLVGFFSSDISQIIFCLLSVWFFFFESTIFTQWLIVSFNFAGQEICK